MHSKIFRNKVEQGKERDLKKINISKDRKSKYLKIGTVRAKNKQQTVLPQ